MPASSGARSGAKAAAPPYAASTCSHRPCRSAHIGDLRQRVDRAGARGARAGDDGERHRAVGQVRGDRILQRIDAHPQPLVGRDRADGRLADAQQVGRLDVGGVRLGRRVHGHPRAAQPVAAHRSRRARVAGGLERGEVGRRSARGHQPARALGQPEPPGEQPHQVQLQLAGRRREHPAAAVGVEAGRQQIGRGAGHGAAPRDVRHEARMAGVAGVLEAPARAAARRSARRASAAPAAAMPWRARPRRPARRGPPAARAAARAARSTGRASDR